ncbi:MAG: tRNA 2-selenouridine(34) synthase MnmH [Bacteroidales bacterium]|nr:tRNA 2-selenouridine(34) synthase MnmH [Bacteroidales bacterium]
MPEILNIEDFFQLIGQIPVVDVRSPGEFLAGHIPGAVNIPVFNNEERKLVGTRYKNSGKEFAIKLGIQLVEPKLENLKKQALETAEKNELLLHCWRGGMRSEKMAELFETCGIKIRLILGGYNSYRRFIREKFAEDSKLIILGGYTGSGKTDVLKALEKAGEQIIDLEGIANHKGSAFGDIGQNPQPTNEQFENNLALVWSKLRKADRIWIEDESITIGANGIPDTLWRKMRNTTVVKINIPLKTRAERLVREYAGLDKEKLANSLLKISKRIGNDNLKRAIIALENNDFETVAKISLIYYDKAYLRGISQRNQELVNVIDIFEDNPEKTASLLIEFIQNNKNWF